MKYIVANLKSHMNEAEVEAWMQAMVGLPSLNGDCQVIVAGVYVYLPRMKAVADELRLRLSVASQGVSPFPYGAYTGEVSAQMLQQYVTYALVGHSERRRYFHETNQEVVNQVEQLLEVGITPIVCVDVEYAVNQLTMFDSSILKKLVVAYEPLAAIGSGSPDTPDETVQVIQRIWDGVGTNVPVLYGGSVSVGNVKSFVEREEIAGALVGGASLDAQNWMSLVEASL